MKFGPIDIQQAYGKILAHNLSDASGKRRVRKGTILGDEHIALIREMGLSQVYVAELEHQDLPEEQAAPRIAACLAGDHIELQGAATGRTNLIASSRGIVQVDRARLDAVNRIQGITVATLPQHKVVSPRGIIASVKIIPYGIAVEAVDEAMLICGDTDGVIKLIPFEQQEVALILTGRPGLEARLKRDFEAPLSERIEALGSRVVSIEFVATESAMAVDQLAEMLKDRVERAQGLILIAGETAIMDERDILPLAIVMAGGEIESLGAPVDPGNLLLLGYLAGVPILGAPGCARSRKENVIDWVLPRLLVGERLTREAIVSLGVGGLLEDVKERPQRRQTEAGENNG
jgi:molybdenum cofactor cytidylyltransferase